MERFGLTDCSQSFACLLSGTSCESNYCAYVFSTPQPAYLYGSEIPYQADSRVGIDCNLVYKKEPTTTMKVQGSLQLDVT